MTPTLNPALRDFWLAPRTADGAPVRTRVLYGGRASSKSWDAAGFAIFLAQSFKIKVLCARQFQSKIEESVYTLLKNTIERFGLSHKFRILENKIICTATGSEFIFYGLWRHINEIKSLEGVDICWLEEAHALTEEQWSVLDPTMRKEGSQFWVIFNPDTINDFVWRKFVSNPPVGTITRQINYDENPFLSQTMLAQIDDMRARDPEAYQHIYLGTPYANDDAAIIKRTWLLSAINAHVALGHEPSGQWRIGYDVADKGADKCAMVEAHGCLATYCDEWSGAEDELLKSTTRVWDRAVQQGSLVIYDEIGVGAGVGAKLRELNTADSYGRPRTTPPIRWRGFNAGAAVIKPDAFYRESRRKNRDMFCNAKAQVWWDVADRLRETHNAVQNGAAIDPGRIISISPDIAHLQSLIDELCTPRRDYDDHGRVKVESKRDLAKPSRKGGAAPSPNKADAFIMCYWSGGYVMTSGTGEGVPTRRGNVRI